MAEGTTKLKVTPRELLIIQRSLRIARPEIADDMCDAHRRDDLETADDIGLDIDCLDGLLKRLP